LELQNKYLKQLQIDIAVNVIQWNTWCEKKRKKIYCSHTFGTKQLY